MVFLSICAVYNIWPLSSVFSIQISDWLHDVRFSISGEGLLWVSHSFCITVVRGLKSDYNYHRRYSDASVSSEFRLWVFQRVRLSLDSFHFSRSTWWHFRAYESPPVSNLTSFKIKQTSTPSTALDRVEMAIHTNTERHPTSSTRDDISSTIVSTNEQMGR